MHGDHLKLVDRESVAVGLACSAGLELYFEYVVFEFLDLALFSQLVDPVLLASMAKELTASLDRRVEHVQHILFLWQPRILNLTNSQTRGAATRFNTKSTDIGP